MNTVDAGVLALLGGFLVDVARKPDAGGWQGAPGASQFRNYVMLTPGPGETDGSLAVADYEVDRPYQTTCVAATADGASILAASVVTALSGQRIETATRVTTKPISLTRYGSIDPDDTVQPPVFMVAHIFSVVTVPV